MATPEVPHPKPGKGKHKPGADGKKAKKGLNKKLGPLPVWGWGVGLLLAIALGLYIRNRAGKSQTSDQTATPTNTGAGSGGGGIAPLPPQPVDTAPPPLPADTLGAALPQDFAPFDSGFAPWDTGLINDTVPLDATPSTIYGVAAEQSFADIAAREKQFFIDHANDPAYQPGAPGYGGFVSANSAAARPIFRAFADTRQPKADTAAGFLGRFGTRSIGRIPIVTVRPPTPAHRAAPTVTVLHHPSVRSAISLGEHSRREREGGWSGGGRHAGTTSKRAPTVYHEPPQHHGYSGYSSPTATRRPSTGHNVYT